MHIPCRRQELTAMETLSKQSAIWHEKLVALQEIDIVSQQNLKELRAQLHETSHNLLVEKVSFSELREQHRVLSLHLETEKAAGCATKTTLEVV
jgi:hypothetical protein